MKRTRNAFTLIEMLIVIAIISILAAMAISAFSNAAQDSREVLVRQQLATFQEAVNNWAAREIGKVVTGPPGLPAATAPTYGPGPRTIEQVRGIYNGASTAGARLSIFDQYLDDATRTRTATNLVVDAATGRITTDAMRQTGWYLTLPAWGSGSYPKVQMDKL